MNGKKKCPQCGKLFGFVYETPWALCLECRRVNKPKDKCVHFKRNELIKINNPVMFMVTELIRAGAPIKILRESITDTKDYTDDEVVIYGNLKVSKGDFGDLFYTFTPILETPSTLG